VFVANAFDCIGITFPTGDAPGLTSLENSSMNCFFCIFLCVKYPTNSKIMLHVWVPVRQVRQDAFGGDEIELMAGDEPSWNVAWDEAPAQEKVLAEKGQTRCHRWG